jgi:phosphatidylinositol 4-kinase
MRSLAAYSIICYLLQVKDRHNGNILVDAEGHIVHIDFGFMLSNTPGNVGFEQAPFKLSQEFIDIMGGTGSALFAEFRVLCQEAFLAVRKRWDVVVALVEVMEKESTFPCFTGHSTKPKDKPSGLSIPASGSGASQSGSSSLFGFLGGGSSSAGDKEGLGGSNTSVASNNSNYAVGTGSGVSGGPALGNNTLCPVAAKLRERFVLGMAESQVRDMVDRLVDSSMNSVFTRLYDTFQWYSNGVL